MKLQKIVSLNPSENYKVIGEVSVSTHDEVDAKVARARKAQQSWADLSVKGRILYLEKVYKALSVRKKDIAMLTSQEMGMPIKISGLIDIDLGLQYLRGYLDNAQQWLASETVFESKDEIHHLFYEPKGVVGISIPWNYPFLLFIWSIMPNLIVGNTVVFKHSEECPLTGKLLEEIVGTAGLPEGVFNEVYGDGSDVGEYLMNSAIDLIYFTGSSGVGKHLYQVAAKKFVPAVLELGGSAPGIVFEDADIDSSIEAIFFNRFLNSGQSCDGLKRLLVHRKLYDEVVEKLKYVITTKKVGIATDPATDLGPLVAERQVVRIEEQVQDALKKGAQCVIGGNRSDNLKGAYYNPTILTNITFDMSVWKEEVFGPVLPVVPFDSEQEAIKLGNDTSYGLGGYLYTNSKERALRVSSQLKTGNICVNGSNYNVAQDPFGGYKNSGLGREHGEYGFRELCNVKVVSLKK